ncbi:hypothetical protein EB75_14330 [Mycobacterium sp. ST-F2]|nr:hypothetical protein EB75_14330 [Mycobacterium sp. ST-F2]
MHQCNIAVNRDHSVNAMPYRAHRYIRVQQSQAGCFRRRIRIAIWVVQEVFCRHYCGKASGEQHPPR